MDVTHLLLVCVSATLFVTGVVIGHVQLQLQLMTPRQQRGNRDRNGRNGRR